MTKILSLTTALVALLLVPMLAGDVAIAGDKCPTPCIQSASAGVATDAASAQNASSCRGGTAAASEKKAETKQAHLCGSCGEIKGGESCCAAGAAKCDKCGLAKGSPGCCKIEKGEDVALCGHCGEIKGGEKCCAKDATACGACGLQAGSPGCKAACTMTLCDHCGEIKGGEKCCAADATKCGKCGLHAGSPGCKATCMKKESGEV